MAITNRMNPVIHFEMPMRDEGRVRKFYESAFGWQTTAPDPEAGGFVLAFTIETDAKTRIPEKRGAINGGFYRRTKPEEGVTLTILVDDIREAIEKIEASGGTVLGEPLELPGVGLFASFKDTEGNVVNINEDFTIKRL